jgi:hypothetical protein
MGVSLFTRQLAQSLLVGGGHSYFDTAVCGGECERAGRAAANFSGPRHRELWANKLLDVARDGHAVGIATALRKEQSPWLGRGGCGLGCRVRRTHPHLGRHVSLRAQGQRQTAARPVLRRLSGPQDGARGLGRLARRPGMRPDSFGLAELFVRRQSREHLFGKSRSTPFPSHHKRRAHLRQRHRRLRCHHVRQLRKKRVTCRSSNHDACAFASCGFFFGRVTESLLWGCVTLVGGGAV